MFANKIHLTQDYIDLIVKKRKEHNYTAYELSEKLGKNKSWLPNIENHRTKNLSKENLLLIFNDFAKGENMDTEEYIIKYLHPNAIVELEDGSKTSCFLLQTKLQLSSSSTQYISPIYTDEINKQKELYNIRVYLDDLTNYILDEYEKLNENAKSIISSSLEKIDYNLKVNLLLTFNFYGIDLFGDSYPDNIHGDFAQKTNNEIEDIIISTKEIFDIHNAKTEVYNYFSTNESDNAFLLEDDHYTEYDSPLSTKEKTTELSSDLENIECYLASILRYVNIAFQYSQANTVDFHKIYGVAKQYLCAFINKANIKYDLIISLPTNNSVSQAEINTLHLKFISALQDVKQLFKKKYSIYLQD